jgi:hypothetical protein
VTATFSMLLGMNNTQSTRKGSVGNNDKRLL